ncbi:MAG: ABC transporter permease [Acidobacteriota bacterium]|nr:ABC transporter permease [Acidobacteriota bacterium]
MRQSLARLAARKGWAGIFLALIGGWEVFARSEIVEPSVYLPPFTEVANFLVAEGGILEILPHIFRTLARALLGFLIALLISVPAGLAMGFHRFLFKLINPLVEFLRPMPPIAIVPVAILFLGIFDKMKVAVVTFACVWPILVNTCSGVRNIEQEILDAASLLSLPYLKLMRSVVLMASLPFIVSGAKIALSISVIVSVAAEMIVGNKGIGFYILDAERSFRFVEMYAGLLVLAAFGLALNVLFSSSIEKLMPWEQS